jgi:hypothetical protein
MKGYMDLALMALMTVLIGLFVIAIFVPISQGDIINPYPVKEVDFKETCNTKSDCDKNYKGSLCLTVYPGDYLPFCGCVTNDDCQSGLVQRSNVCLSNNRCKMP